MASDAIAISVVYALADLQEVVKLTVPHGTTVAEAVELSGLARKFPEIGTLTSERAPITQRSLPACASV